MEVYLVKSGHFEELIGWDWTNLAVFDNNDAAVAFARNAEIQIKQKIWMKLNRLKLNVLQ